MCKFISSLFFAAQLFLIGYLFSFDGTSLFDREGYDVSARDRKDGRRVFTQDGSMV